MISKWTAVAVGYANIAPSALLPMERLPAGTVTFGMTWQKELAMACGRRAFLGLAALGMAGAALGAAQRGADMKHVVLLGDSVFDNARYVDGKPDVLARLRSHLAEGW